MIKIRNITEQFLIDFKNKLNSLKHDTVKDSEILTITFYDSVYNEESEIFKFPFKVFTKLFPEIEFKERIKA